MLAFRSFSGPNLISACLIGWLAGFLLWMAHTEYNPDWNAYQAMYQSGGAWLAEQGRDMAFLMLLDAAYFALGANGYEEFRVLVAMYFFIFVLALGAGWIIPLRQSWWVTLQFPLAVTAFAMTRITIQIREGIAVTLVILAMGILFRGGNALHKRVPLVARLWVLPMLLVAVLMHMGMLVVLGAVVLSHFGAGIVGTNRRVLWYVSAGANIGILLWVISGGIATVTGSVGDNLSDRILSEVDGDWGTGKALFWLVYLGLAYLVHREVKFITLSHAVWADVGLFMWIMSGPIALSLLMSVLVLIVAGAPNVVVGYYVRELGLVIGILVLIIAARSTVSVVALWLSIFLLLYQLRAIHEGLEATWGMGLVG